MEGIFFHHGSAGAAQGKALVEGGTPFELLAKHGPMEIMLVNLHENDVIWLTSANDDAVMEFFYLISGALTIVLREGPVLLDQDESFYLQKLEQDIPVRAESDTRILYVTNSPMFDSSCAFEDNLKQLLLQINEKDRYTYRHSGNVMHYVRLLYEHFQDECGEVALEDLIVASLFHDVGKCYVPGEVLRKTGQLEQEDVRLLLRHPRDSAKLLRPHFGEKVAEIAAKHHERLDGSGYPCGYMEEDISFAARLLAVADVFDAMTTDRGYNVVKDELTAAEELFSLPEQFDRRITARLLELIHTGKLAKPTGGNDEQIG